MVHLLRYCLDSYDQVSNNRTAVPKSPRCTMNATVLELLKIVMYYCSGTLVLPNTSLHVFWCEYMSCKLLPDRSEIGDSEA